MINQLAALAHEARLSIFRLLVRRGREGLAAGEIGTRLNMPASALSFHLKRLCEARLIRKRRNGRRLMYSAEFATMRRLVRYLTRECCIESDAGCGPECPPPSVTTRIGRREVSPVHEAEEP